MSLVLVDTDILVDASRGEAAAIEYLATEEARGTVNISAVTRMELLIGCRDKTELRAVERFLSRFVTLPLTEAISQRAVKLVTDYHLSHNMRIPDALIAATALTAALPMATKNQKHFKFIPGLKVATYLGK
ncbi:MAG: hypothetical protein FD161_4824 [Limisphaerales bacterium]|nr:MAG: hypothetical protein FD161_4824 [Limisphaerales bacterium]TXT49457.1 MAG: hypothetical protein FD140_2989 [Limisphaerales bacterium]